MDDDIEDFCQLAEDEIEAELRLRAERREVEREAARQLAKKQTSFRWRGGMP